MQITINALQKVFQIVLSKKHGVLCDIEILVIMFHLAHDIRAILVSNWEQSTLYTKT